MQTATVFYQVASYTGNIQVTCHPDEDNDVIIARAIAKLRRLYGHLPFGYRYFKILKRE